MGRAAGPEVRLEGRRPRQGRVPEAIRMYTSLEGKAITTPGGGRIVVEVVLHIALVDAARQARSGRSI